MAGHTPVRRTGSMPCMALPSHPPHSPIYSNQGCWGGSAKRWCLLAHGSRNEPAATSKAREGEVHGTWCGGGGGAYHSLMRCGRLGPSGVTLTVKNRARRHAPYLRAVSNLVFRPLDLLLRLGITFRWISTAHDRFFRSCAAEGTTTPPRNSPWAQRVRVALAGRW